MGNFPITSILAGLSPEEGFRTTLILNERSPLAAGPITPSPGEAVVVTTNSKVKRTFNFDDASPNWSDIPPDGTGDIYKIHRDEHDDRRAWLAAENGVWVCSDITISVPVWTQVLTPAQFLSITGEALHAVRDIQTSRSYDGYTYCQAQGANSRLHIGRLVDGSWNFTEMLATSKVLPVGFRVRPNYHKQLLCAAGSTGSVFKSEDAAETFQLHSSFAGGIGPIRTIEWPMNKSGVGGDIFVSGFAEGSGGPEEIIVPSIKDAWVWSLFPDNNWGSAISFPFIYDWSGPNKITYAAVEFDLSVIPESWDLDECTIELRAYASDLNTTPWFTQIDAANLKCIQAAITESWEEDEITYNNFPNVSGYLDNETVYVQREQFFNWPYDNGAQLIRDAVANEVDYYGQYIIMVEWTYRLDVPSREWATVPQRIHLRITNPGSGEPRIIRNPNSATHTDITPEIDDVKMGALSYYSMAGSRVNVDTIKVLATPYTATQALVLDSVNAGDDWVEKADMSLISPAGTKQAALMLHPDDDGKMYLLNYGSSGSPGGMIQYSKTSGSSWQDKTGDWTDDWDLLTPYQGSIEVFQP